MLVAKHSPSLIALKPRQVVLSSNSTKAMKNEASAHSLNPRQKSRLLLSVAYFLQRNSFSKTLKKFLSEAQIQKNDLTGSSLDLEEMCCKYLAMSDHSKPNLSKEQFQDVQANHNLSSDGQVGSENTTKKKKMGGDESSKVDDKSANSAKSEEQFSHEASEAPAADIMGRLQLDESAKKQKEKKKKKSKSDSESHFDAECLAEESEKSKDAIPTESNRVSDAGIDNNSKDKKRKKKLTSDSYVDRVEQHGSEDKQQAVTNVSDISLEDKTSKSKTKRKRKDDSEEVAKEKRKEDSTIADGKGLKKRKRLDFVVHDSQPVHENSIEDSKRRKPGSSDERCSKLNSSVGADKHISEESNGVSGELGVNDIQKKPAKQLNELENGNIEKNVKNCEQKSSKKQQDGSVQPKKPFQRVNIDEVVFVDKRLEDNSYWAKDGAEIGYGAKAQEVLGQVRGSLGLDGDFAVIFLSKMVKKMSNALLSHRELRGFRHEKTKKKRGSYRGGQIDMQSYSIKFNYSDDE